jgi:hypothetical protein
MTRLVGEVGHEEPVGGYKIKNREVAVATDYYWNPIKSCPRSVKVQLLGRGGVAVYGMYNGDSFWQEWAPLPQRRNSDA